MLIPKDSTIIINVWNLHMDEKVFKDPREFIPERYSEHPLLASKYAVGSWEKRDHYSYGVGRRICAGMNIAERNVFIGLAKLLWAFEFDYATGPDGKQIPIDTDPITGYEHGIIHGPREFKFKATVRSEARKETIMREFEEAQNVFAKFS